MRLIACHISRRGPAVIASLLIGIVLLLNALAASPTLHELLHKDTNSPEHHCAVTIFAHGQVDATTLDVPIAVSLAWLQPVPSFEFPVFSPAIGDLPAERAPPVLPAVS